MADDETFRLILALGMAAFLPVALYHRTSGRRPAARSSTVVRRDRSSSSRCAPAGWRRWAASWPSSSTRPGCRGPPCRCPPRCAGPAWGSVCPRWHSASGRSAASAGTSPSTVVTRREHMLVTNGPYRYVRHPFYVTTALAFAANALAAANWFIALTGFAALTLLVLPDRDRGGEARRAFRRRLPALHDADGPLLPARPVRPADGRVGHQGTHSPCRDVRGIMVPGLLAAASLPEVRMRLMWSGRGGCR